MTPRIYVASLSDYNAGRLHGDWIDLDGLEAEDIGDAIAAMLDRSPEPIAEEWAIHDYEGFGSVGLSEWEDLDKVAAWARGIVEHGEAFTAWVANDPTYNTDPEDFEEAYRGTFDSLADYVEEFVHDCHTEAEMGPYAQYIDWERVARDFEYGGDLWTTRVSDGVAVFS